jgi:dihydroflavonol-4-reductase
MPTALVTGATGFIGSHLAEALMERGYEVACLVRRTSDLRWTQGIAAKHVCTSIEDEGALDEAVAGKDYVFHCAGLTKARDEQTYFRVNAEGTKRLLEACVRQKAAQRLPDGKAGRFVYFSSQAAAGPSPDGTPLTEESPCHPITPYGRSKLQGEVYAHEFSSKLPITIIRPSAVYGPRDRDVLFFFKIINRGLIFLSLPPEKSFVNVVYVGDLVKAGILAAENDTAVGKTYFATHPQAVSWAEAIAAVSRALGKRCRVVRVPGAVMKCAGLLCEFGAKMSGKPPLINREKVKEISQRFWVCSTQKIESELGFRADHSFEEGAKIAARWYKEEGWL